MGLSRTSLKGAQCRRPLLATGFSIVELVVALAVGAIALTLAVPSYSNWVRANRVATQTSTFVTAMNMARLEAVQRQLNVTVAAIDEAWTNGWTVVDANARVIRQFPTLRDAESLTLASENDNTEYTYIPTGRLSIPVGDNMTICDDAGEGRTVSIGPTGRVTVAMGGC